MSNPARVRQLKEIMAEQKCEIIGLQETIKQDFSDQDLRGIAGGQNFVWNWIPPHGHSGGILL